MKVCPKQGVIGKFKLKASVFYSWKVIPGMTMLLSNTQYMQYQYQWITALIPSVTAGKDRESSFIFVSVKKHNIYRYISCWHQKATNRNKASTMSDANKQNKHVHLYIHTTMLTANLPSANQWNQSAHPQWN